MRSVYTLSISFVFLFLLFAFSASAAQASGFLKFDQTNYSVTSGNTFQVQVIVDPGTDSISGTDAHVTYDATLLQAVSVTPGTYFPSVSNNITAGKVSIWGVYSAASPKTGVGTIATITFKPLTNSTATLAYFCDATASNSSKVVKYDINSPNIIDCTQNQTATVTMSGVTSSGVVPTTAATPPATLPQSGGFSDLLPITTGGILLLFFGIVIRRFIL